MGLKLLGLGAVGGLVALTSAAKIGWAEFAEGEKVTAQTNATLKSTGGIANVTEAQIGDLATTLMRMSGIDDELIQSGENLLLTFKNVRNEVGAGNDIFNQATEAALNLSVAGFGSVESASKMMGKALQDPIRGMTALGRAGVTFSEEQRAAITAMVESNDLLGAQKIILKEVESQVGGSAKALGETLPGQINIARETINNFLGDIVERLVPALASMISWLRDHWPQIQAAIQTFWASAEPILVALGQLLQAAWPIAQKAIELFLPVLQSIAQVLQGVVQVISGILSGDWSLVWEGLKNVAAGAITAMWNLIKAQLELLKAGVLVVLGLVRDAFEVAFRAVSDFVGARVGDIVGFFTALPSRLLATIEALVSTALAPFRAAFGAARNAIGGIIDDVVSFFIELPRRIADTLGALAGQALGPFKGLFRSAGEAVEFVGEAIRWLRDNATKIIAKVVDTVKGPFGVLAGALSPVEHALGQILAFLEGIRDKAGDFVAAVDKIIGAISRIPSLPSLPSLPSIGAFIPGRQHGGPVLAGMPYLVGEKGPEVWVPRSSGTIIPNDALRSGRAAGTTGGAAGPTFVFNFHGFMIGSRDELADRVTEMVVSRTGLVGRVAAYESRV